MKLIFKRIQIPLLFLCLMALVDVTALYGIIPSNNEIFSRVVDLINNTNRGVIFLLSVLEHTFFLNVYFPGAVVILVAMGATYGNYFAAVSTLLAICLGQAVGYLTSYFLGRVSPSRQQSSEFIDNKWLLFITYAHPHSAAISSYVLGLQKVTLWKFFYKIGCAWLFWGIFWGVVAYFGFVSIASEIGWDFIFYAYLICWIAYSIFVNQARKSQ